MNAIYIADACMRNCPNFLACIGSSEFLVELVKSLPRYVRDPNYKTKGIFKNIFRKKEEQTVNSLEVSRNRTILVCIEEWTLFNEYEIFSEMMLKMVVGGVIFAGDEKGMVKLFLTHRELLPFPCLVEEQGAEPSKSEISSNTKARQNNAQSKRLSMSESGMVFEQHLSKQSYDPNVYVPGAPFNSKDNIPPPVGTYNYRYAISAHNLSTLFRDIIHEADIYSIVQGKDDFLVEMHQNCLKERKTLNKTIGKYTGGVSGITQLLRALNELNIYIQYYNDLRNGLSSRRSHPEIKQELYELYVREGLLSVEEHIATGQRRSTIGHSVNLQDILLHDNDQLDDNEKKYISATESSSLQRESSNLLIALGASISSPTSSVSSLPVVPQGDEIDHVQQQPRPKILFANIPLSNNNSHADSIELENISPTLSRHSSVSFNSQSISVSTPHNFNSDTHSRSFHDCPSAGQSESDLGSRQSAIMNQSLLRSLSSSSQSVPSLPQVGLMKKHEDYFHNPSTVQHDIANIHYFELSEIRYIEGDAEEGNYCDDSQDCDREGVPNHHMLAGITEEDSPLVKTRGICTDRIINN